MPFTFIAAGIVLLIVGVKGNASEFFSLVKGDFVSPPGSKQATFVPWVASILIVGSVGYVPKLQTLSRMFLVLLILVLFLANANKKAGGGFFAKLQEQFPQLFPAPKGQ